MGDLLAGQESLRKAKFKSKEHLRVGQCLRVRNLDKGKKKKNGYVCGTRDLRRII